MLYKVEYLNTRFAAARERTSLNKSTSFTFLIAGTALLAAALLVAFLLQRQHSTSANGEPDDSPVSTVASATQHQAFAGDGYQKGEHA
jgi:hypothetical protein